MFGLTPNRKRSALFLFILLSFFVGSLIIENPDFPYGICLFKTFTGLPCPSCGMTHSFVSIGHLRIYEGFFYNILGPFLYLLMLSGIFICVIEIYLDRLIIEPLFRRYEKKILLTVIPLVIISWIFNLYKTTIE